MPLVRISDLIGVQQEIDDLFDRATMISQLYDDHIEADEGDAHTRAPGIHASEISKCERRLVYSILDTPKKSNIRKNMRQRFEVGKAIHAMVQRDFMIMAMKSRGLMSFEPEVPISPKYQDIAKELNIHSSCDGVFTFRDDPFGPAVLRIGLEIKTEAPDGYEGLKGPKADHIEQAHVYMRALDLPIMWFLYMNKGNQNNTSSIPPFLIKYDHAIWQRLEDRCRRVLAMADKKELPDRNVGFHCDFCPYSHTCQPVYVSTRVGGSSKWKQPRST